MYTHYFRLSKELRGTNYKTPEICQDVRMLMMKSEIPVANGSGEEDTEPVLSDLRISFNGVGEEGCEEFDYPPGRDNFNFNDEYVKEERDLWWCKTSRRQYDVLVAAALISVKHHLEDAALVGSDGYDDEEEWIAARGLYAATFPERTFPEINLGKMPATRQQQNQPVD